MIVDREPITIVGGAGNETAPQARCEDLRREIDATRSEYHRETLQERLAKLAGGVS